MRTCARNARSFACASRSSSRSVWSPTTGKIARRTRVVGVLDRRAGEREQDPALAAHRLQIGDQLLLDAIVRPRAHLVHHAEQQIDQAVGDLRDPRPAETRQQREPRRRAPPALPVCRLAHARRSPARWRAARSHPRTVPGARSSSRAIWRCLSPSTGKRSASPITSALSRRRGTDHAWHTTCVRAHPAGRPRPAHTEPDLPSIRTPLAHETTVMNAARRD